MELTLAEVAEVTGGRPVGVPGAVVVSGVAFDSRRLQPGELFVALIGRRDGHEFVAAAAAAGAAAALVSRRVEVGLPQVVVPDTRRALFDLAGLARRRIGDRPVVGITGSAGKTSTKDLLAGALGRGRRVHASAESFNNEIGLPTALCATPDDADVVVLEMGCRFPGNITELCRVAQPRVGIVTNVGLAHAEYLGGPDGVARAKGELLEALPAEGLAVCNADDPRTPELRRRSRAPVLLAGTHPAADVGIERLIVDDELRPRFRLVTPWGRAEVHLGVRGAHQATNAALAAGAAGALGVPVEAIAAGLGTVGGAAWRMELTRTPGGVVVCNDAYNASPSATEAALRALAHLRVTGRRVAVLGPMLELGPYAEDAHSAIGRLAAVLGFVVVAVGVEAEGVAAGATAEGAEVHRVPDPDRAAALLVELVRPGDAVLVKASRAAGLERVARALTAVGPDR
jgi:UDP-N-acetylmuramoyl-tripeptide--D-alanyl-D-alanine ligase